MPMGGRAAPFFTGHLVKLPISGTAKVGERPKLGRRSVKDEVPEPTEEPNASSESIQKEDEVNKQNGGKPAKIQTQNTRPVRSTRNPNPNYVV